MAINIGTGSGNGIIGGIDCSLGVPPASISFSQGSQLNDVTSFTSQGQVPVYTYVVEGIPRVQISTERGVDKSPDELAQDAGDVSAEFLTIGGTTNINISGTIIDPAGSASTGANGASVSFIKTSST